MRDPSIHIRRSDLINVFRRLEMDVDKVDLIFKLTKHKRVKNRFLTAEKIYTDNTGKFVNILHTMRMQHNHRGIVQIKKGDKNWKVCSGIASKVEDFSIEFGLTFEDAARMTIEQGLKSKIFRLNALNPEKIRDKVYIEKSGMRKQAVKALDIYLELVGLEGYKKNFLAPEILINFVFLVEQTEDVREWIKAQIEGLKWTNSIPEPYQLHGEKAFLRYAKTRHEIKENKKSSITDILGGR